MASARLYGNLGLAYQKAGNTAESIWANRKAIALANGTNAATRACRCLLQHCTHL